MFFFFPPLHWLSAAVTDEVREHYKESNACWDTIMLMKPSLFFSELRTDETMSKQELKVSKNIFLLRTDARPAARSAPDDVNKQSRRDGHLLGRQNTHRRLEQPGVDTCENR